MFRKFSVEALIDSSSKVNVIQPSFAKDLGLRICKINVDAQKIDCSRLKTYEIVIVFFQVDDKDRKSRFFEETFLLIDIGMNIAFEIRFLTLSNVKINSNNKKLKLRLYTVADHLSNTRQVELVRKKKFVIVVL